MILARKCDDIVAPINNRVLCHDAFSNAGQIKVLAIEIAHRLVLARHPLPLAAFGRNRSACIAQLRHCTLPRPEGPSVARSPELGLDAYWWRLSNETVCRSVTALRIVAIGFIRARVTAVQPWTCMLVLEPARSRETRLLPRLPMTLRLRFASFRERASRSFEHSRFRYFDNSGNQPFLCWYYADQIIRLDSQFHLSDDQNNDNNNDGLSTLLDHCWWKEAILTSRSPANSLSLLEKHKRNSRCSRMFFQCARHSYLSRSPCRGPRGGCCSDPLVAVTKQRCSRSACRRLSPATIPRRLPNTANTEAALIIPLIVINGSAASPQRGCAECVGLPRNCKITTK